MPTVFRFREISAEFIHFRLPDRPDGLCRILLVSLCRY